jgi:hypothetical protein
VGRKVSILHGREQELRKLTWGKALWKSETDEGGQLSARRVNSSASILTRSSRGILYHGRTRSASCFPSPQMNRDNSGRLWKARARAGKLTLVREAVAHKAELALLGVLKDRVESFLLGDLLQRAQSRMKVLKSECMRDCELSERRTSLALDQRGISTIMLRTCGTCR